jgi:hypothetical protein
MENEMSYDGERSAYEQDCYEEMIRMRTLRPSLAHFDGSRPEPPYPTPQADASLRSVEREALERILDAADEEDGSALIHALRDARKLLGR